jgi:hypothetical protein
MNRLGTHLVPINGRFQHRHCPSQPRYYRDLADVVTSKSVSRSGAVPPAAFSGGSFP